MPNVSVDLLRHRAAGSGKLLGSFSPNSSTAFHFISLFFPRDFRRLGWERQEGHKNKTAGEMSDAEWSE